MIMDTKGMGLKPQILLAALDCSGGDMKKSFTAEDMLLRAWERNKSAWGLRGHENEHPDSEKIFKELNSRGSSGLVGQGLLEQVSPLVFRLTPAGLAAASELKPDDIKVRDKASRVLQDQIKSILGHPVFRAWLEDPATPKSFHKVGGFWGIAPGTPPRVARERVAFIEVTLRAAEGLLVARDVQTISDERGRALFDHQDIQRCLEFQRTMKERFAKELQRLGVTETVGFAG
jgi:hypothetical protein